MADYSSDDDPTAQKDPDPGSDEAILAELNERFDYASVQLAPIIDQGDIDVRYSAGHTFDSKDKAARAGRITVELDQLSQYSNQLVNSYRQNPRGIKASAAGGGATDATAELRANRIRQIEYDSHAQEAYTVAGENGATRGYGYVRIVAEYEDATSANQVLRLKAIPNPNQVIPDPDGESTSGADWQYLFFVHTITRREFLRDYPDATVKDFTPDTMARLPRWFGKEGRVQIAEYWMVTETPPASGTGRSTRTVCQYVTNGVELLAKKGQPKKTEWKGRSIPFIACLGKIVYETTEAGEAQKMWQSYIRLARDGAKAYNWAASTKLEVLALPVKTALFAYEGQLDQGQVDLVEKSTHEPVALILAKPTVEGLAGQVLPLPQYGMRAPDISGYEIAGESFRRDVQNALGRYSASDHRLGSTKVTSGVALQELDKSGDLGSYHHVAHYDDMIRETGEKLNELLDFYDDVEKEISTRLPDGSTKRVVINRMTARAPNGDRAYGPDDLRMDPAHRHTITISTGPSHDSQREAGKEAAMALMGNQHAFPIIAADAVRLMDLGPIGDQMAEDLEYLQPPVMQQARQQKQSGEKADPRQLAQKVAQLEQQLQHAEGVMQQQHGELQGKQAEIASKEKIAQLEIASKELIADKDREARIAVAEISSRSKDAALFLEERGRIGAHLADAATQASTELHDHVQADLARTHAAEQTARDQAHQVGMAAAGASAAADAQQAGHEQTLAQGQQAADLAPTPAPPA